MPFKIAMLGQKTIPALDDSRGGVEVVVEELATRMVEKGCEVTCYNRTGYDNGSVSEYKGVKLKPVFTIHKKGLAAVSSSFFGAIKAAIGEYDFVHFHSEGPCFFIWIPKLFGKKCIATIHGLDWQREKWDKGFGSRYIKWGEKAAVRFADEIIVLSKGAQEYFQSTYDRKTVLIPNGVNKPKEIKKPNEITEKFGLMKDNYILSLGRIVPEKGLRYLIEAFKGVETGKKLVISGSSSDTDDFLQELKELASNDDRILFTGFVSGNLREELYSNAYLYCLPSDLEGMPLSLLEAMSYGNCCVVSDIPECIDVVENKAVVFHRGDIEDLRNKLQQLCSSENLVLQYKDSASDFICTKYDWDNVTEETIKLYGY